MAVQHLKIEVLTPTYIGGAAEKHFQKNIDFFWEDGNIYYIPEYRLQHFITDRELQFIINGKFEDYKIALKRKGANFKKLALYQWECSHQPEQNEIKSFIRNGQGLPFIPGSSVKGAISSHLFKHLQEGNNKTTAIRLKELASFFQLTDAYFSTNATDILPAKVFNLTGGRGDFIGGWKHSFRNATNNQFKPNGFVTHYESLKKDTYSFCRIKLIDEQDFQFKGKNVKDFERKLDWWGSNDVEALFKIINHQTRSHLEKELKFYTKYKAQYSEELSTAMEQLLKQIIMENNSAILRLGGGSGFHSITGDYIHDSYYIDNIAIDRGRSRGKNNKKDSAKSRKISFIKKDNGYEFYPFGFVKISIISSDEYESGKKMILESGENSSLNIEIEKAKAPEPPKEIKPEWQTFEQLKQGDVVDAKVVRTEGMRVIVKLFIKDYEQEHDFRFPAGLEPNTLVQVDIKNFSGKGNNRKIQAIGFKGIKK